MTVCCHDQDMKANKHYYLSHEKRNAPEVAHKQEPSRNAPCNWIQDSAGKPSAPSLRAVFRNVTNEKVVKQYGVKRPLLWLLWWRIPLVILQQWRDGAESLIACRSAQSARSCSAYTAVTSKNQPVHQERSSEMPADIGKGSITSPTFTVHLKTQGALLFCSVK